MTLSEQITELEKALAQLQRQANETATAIRSSEKVLAALKAQDRLTPVLACLSEDTPKRLIDIAIELGPLGYQRTSALLIEGIARGLIERTGRGLYVLARSSTDHG